jgi:hypothetical protein
VGDGVKTTVGVLVGSGVSVGVGLGVRVPVGVAVGGTVAVGVLVSVGVGVEVAVGVEVTVKVGVGVGGSMISATRSTPLETVGANCMTPTVRPARITAPRLSCKTGKGFAFKYAPQCGQVRNVLNACRPHTSQRIRLSTIGLVRPHSGHTLQSGFTGVLQSGQ